MMMMRRVMRSSSTEAAKNVCFSVIFIALCELLITLDL